MSGGELDQTFGSLGYGATGTTVRIVIKNISRPLTEKELAGMRGLGDAAIELVNVERAHDRG